MARRKVKADTQSLVDYADKEPSAFASMLGGLIEANVRSRPEKEKDFASLVARVGIWVPTVSRSRQMRWSYSDLLAVRLIDWLRRDKPDLEIPHTSMSRIRYALEAVEQLGEELGPERVMVWVDRGGGIVLRAGGETFVPVPALQDQPLLDVGPVDLIAAFSRPDIEAPDLAEPRPTLRIVPGKLASEPHVTHTRVSTRNLAALSKRGLSREAILALYPSLSSRNVEEALALEVQLERNLHPAAA